MDKNLIITIVGVAVASIGLVFVFTPLQGTVDENPNCMTAQEARDDVRYYTEHCSTDFEELGFETAESCYERLVALFDPRMCS